MAKPRLIDDVKASLNDRKGFTAWHESLPSGIAAEIGEVKSQWRAGTLGTTKTALAKSLSKALAARGVSIGHAGVIRWLERP